MLNAGRTALYIVCYGQLLIVFLSNFGDRFSFGQMLAINLAAGIFFLLYELFSDTVRKKKKTANMRDRA